MELQRFFEQAVANSKLLSSKPDNETLLKLYSFTNKLRMAMYLRIMNHRTHSILLPRQSLMHGMN